MAAARIWNTWTGAPHRVMFLGGMVQVVLSMVLWAVELTGRYVSGWPRFSTAVFSTWAHAWAMLFGLFTFFIFGFLMTTFPRWMNGPAVRRGHYLASFFAQAMGVLVFYVGLFVDAQVMLCGVVLHCIGMALGILALHQVRRGAAVRERTYENQLTSALVLGLLAEALYGGWLTSGDAQLLAASLHGGLWLFLLPVLVLVAHRMLPLFSGAVVKDYEPVQPRWSFPLLWGGVALRFLLETTGARQWLAAADVPLLFLAIHHSLAWQPRRCLGDRLLASLHLAFAWLPFGMLLMCIQDLWPILGGGAVLGRAPLHALGVGLTAGMLMTMVTRVSRGHSGLRVEIDARDWYGFLVVFFATLIRVVAEIDFIPAAGSLALVAAFLWLAAFGNAALRYVPVYLLPRPDGKPG